MNTLLPKDERVKYFLRSEGGASIPILFRQCESLANSVQYAGRAQVKVGATVKNYEKEAIKGVTVKLLNCIERKLSYQMRKNFPKSEPNSL